MAKLSLSKIGLTSVQAKNRLALYGYNQTTGKNSSVFVMLIHQLFNPIVILLIIAAIISVLIGNDFEAAIIIGIVLINVLSGAYQEYKTQLILNSLKKEIDTKVSVYRDNALIEVPKLEIVPGDYIFLKIGNIVPADVFLKQQDNLLIDETVINTNSKNISKEINPKDIKNFSEGIIYAGSVVKMGTAIAKVFATGAATKSGSIINKALRKKHITEYEKELHQISKESIRLVVISIGLLFIISSIFNPAQDLIQQILFTIAIALMSIPESLPAISNIILSRGANKIGKNGAVIKTLAVLENLGNVDYVCTDKTGTLTENSLRLIRWNVNPKYEKHFFDYCYLLTHKSKDSFDIAIMDMLELNNHHPSVKSINFKEIAFDPFLKESGREFTNFALIKGSEQELLAKADWKITNNQNFEGYRKLAIVKKQAGKYEYVASLYFYDPIKKSAAQAFKKAIANGLQLKIITGDTLAVSQLVANEIEFTKDGNEFFNADQLQYSEPNILEQQVKKYLVFYNADPVQKYKIIEALQRNATIAYLGDGINDAPALKLADVGIVVNNANDLARDNADMVLTNKCLSIVIEAIIEGRKSFQNIEKVLLITFTQIFVNLMTYLLLTIFFKFQPILPIQLIISNVIIELSIFIYAFDDVNERLLKKPQHRDFNKIIRLSLLIAIGLTGINILFFTWASRLPTAEIQTLWFAIMTIASLIRILSFRTKQLFYTVKLNKNILLVLLLSIIVTILLSFSNILTTTYTTLNTSYLPLVILLPIASLVTVEVLKLILIKVSNVKHE